MTKKKKSLLIDDFPIPIQKIAVNSETQVNTKEQIPVVKPTSNTLSPQNTTVDSSPKTVSAPPPISIRPQSISITKADGSQSLTPPVSIRPQSISITKPKVIQNAAPSNIVSEPTPELNVNNSFTDEEFYVAWEKFQQTLSDEKKVGFSNLNIPTRNTDNEFVVLVNNVMQENEAKKLLSDAVQFLRAKLNNSTIVIKTKIAEETEIQRNLSPEQRYMEMVAKNPQLEEFRKLLGLEID